MGRYSSYVTCNIDPDDRLLGVLYTLKGSKEWSVGNRRLHKEREDR